MEHPGLMESWKEQLREVRSSSINKNCPLCSCELINRELANELDCTFSLPIIKAQLNAAHVAQLSFAAG